jgi:uncharacterized membrane protein
MADGLTTELFGIPVPSTDPLFLTFVGIHVVLGIGATTMGAAAMFMRKGRGLHSRFGTLYFWTLTAVCITMAVLSAMRWRENYHLFSLGVLAFTAVCVGRYYAGRYDLRGLRFHIGGMGVSYVLMLTAFYVDNGKNLPLWKELPPIAFWIVPGAIGVPLIVRAMLRHPLIRAVPSRRAIHGPRTSM